MNHFFEVGTPAKCGDKMLHFVRDRWHGAHESSCSNKKKKVWHHTVTSALRLSRFPSTALPVQWVSNTENEQGLRDGVDLPSVTDVFFHIKINHDWTILLPPLPSSRLFFSPVIIWGFFFAHFRHVDLSVGSKGPTIMFSWQWSLKGPDSYDFWPAETKINMALDRFSILPG